MSLRCLQVANFRNLAAVQIELNPLCNLFYGANGSGKTSVLEAVHYLGLARSFRSHLFRRIIRYDESKFAIFGKVQQDTGMVSIGIEREQSGAGQIRIAGEQVKSRAELAKLLPLQIIDQGSYQLFELGPKLRRQFVDWGVFHVEQTFLKIWKRAEQNIEQRNAALRAKVSISDIQLWDVDLTKLARQLHQMRQQYVDLLLPIVQKYLSLLLEKSTIDISYYPGWDTQIDLGEVLSATIERDRQYGYTGYGPHRADLLFRVNGVPAKEGLSRGQLKLLLFALKLAQGTLFQQLTNKRCIYLIDDLPAELDRERRKILVKILVNLQSQVFVTGLHCEDLQELFPSTNYSLFHVERGAVLNIDF